MTLAPDDPRHGTNNGYGNLGCRCEPCKEARRVWNDEHDWAKYHRERGWRLGLHKPLQVYHAEIEAKHGTEGRYKRCRCELCKAGVAAARRERRKTPNPAVHGANAYANGCRCVVCREANTVRSRERRRAER